MQNTRRSWLRQFAAAGVGWAVWDGKSGFKYWDKAKGEPAPGMRAALLPNRK
ncbi:MAG: hypothetical protein ABSC03_07725 [Verrucomicrobiota bacterium]|jgi:hypothetical protein